MAGIRELMGLNKANFSTVEKDFQDITERLIENENVVKLLHYNTPDCLENKECKVTPAIKKEVARENIRIIPSIKIPKNKGSYIIITFDNFHINRSNPEFMDNIILIDVLSPVDVWLMDSYMMRPFHLMHEIQESLHDRSLNGIGKVLFVGANLLNLGDYVGYQMAFKVINDV